jgi:hypothetical protein
MQRRTFLLGTVAILALPASARAEAIKATLYKNPQCGCCELYAKYLRSNGFDVTVRQTNDLATIHRDGGVPEQLESCHAMFVDGYAVYGHVPVDHVRRLLSERPPVKGITLPGMPVGSPGMPGTKTETFVIYALPKDGSVPTVYAKE